jgi:hypothetical protein
LKGWILVTNHIWEKPSKIEGLSTQFIGHIDNLVALVIQSTLEVDNWSKNGNIGTYK